MTASKQQADAALQMAAAVAAAIQALGEVPSGHLYARLMGHMSLQSYESIVRSLKGAKLVEEKNHLLCWTGPKAAGGAR